jgi:uncharacterized OB-fold protein
LTAAPAFSGPGPDEVFRRNLAEGRFVIQLCGACRTHVFYPRSLCPHCGSAGLSTVPASGRGRVYSTSVNRRRPEAGGPINIALIDLEEGPRLMSRVEGVAPDQVCMGMAVIARIRTDAGEPLLVFAPGGDD